MRRYVKMEPIVPFVLGSGAGAIAGARVTLSPAALQAFLGAFIPAVLWMPQLALGGPERPRFAATGAHASADRHVHASTMSTLMAVTRVAKPIAYGNRIGRRAFDRTPERMFRAVFQLLLCLLALRLLLGAALESDP